MRRRPAQHSRPARLFFRPLPPPSLPHAPLCRLLCRYPTTPGNLPGEGTVAMAANKERAAWAVPSMALALTLLPLLLHLNRRAPTIPYSHAKENATWTRPAAVAPAPVYVSSQCGLVEGWDKLDVCPPPLLEGERTIAPPPDIPNPSGTPRRAEPPKAQPPESHRRFAPSPAPAPWRRVHATEGMNWQRRRKYTVPGTVAR